MTLTGPQALLFAEICVEFSNGNGRNHESILKKVPLFSGLCPLQRISLVCEVMIGVLCKNEPMFPNTIQHHAAIVVLHEILCENIKREIKHVTLFTLGPDLLFVDERNAFSIFFLFIPVELEVKDAPAPSILLQPNLMKILEVLHFTRPGRVISHVKSQ